MKRILFLLVLFLTFAFTLHKFHLSNTKIIFNKDEKSLQVTMRCFVDDIENAIDNKNNIILELGNDRMLKNADTYLKTYLLDNFKITINNKDKSVRYLGNEVEKDIIFFYLEVDSIPQIINLQLENKILLNTFDDQQNVVRLEINGQKKTTVLKKDNFTVAYQF
jgi:hypothetical protein